MQLLAAWETVIAPTTQVQWKLGEGQWSASETVSGNRATRQIPGIKDNEWQVRIRHVFGEYSASNWVSASVTIERDKDAPGATVLNEVRPIPRALAIEWTNPVEVDYKHSEIQVRLQDDTAVRTLFVNGTTVDIFALDPSIQYKARVRAIDRSGNTGDWSNETNGIPSMDAVAESGAQIFSGIGTPIDNPPQNATDGDLYIQDNGHILSLIHI